ncbi:MAG: UDP-glucose 4-epimerase GalE [Sulfobacillus sp.]
MTVLVSGGAGYIGLAVSHVLEEAGHRVVRYDNLSQSAETGSVGVFVQGDVADVSYLSEVMKSHQVTAVMHLAGSISVTESVTRPLAYWTNNVGGAMTLMAAMDIARVHALVFSSTAAVYGEPQFTPITEDHPICPINPYGHTKWAVESLLADLSAAGQLNYVALRYFNASGAIPGILGERHDPEQHLIPNVIRAALSGHPVSIFGSDYPTSDGTAVRDYVHVQDLADAHLLALQHLTRGGASTSLNLANSRGHSVLEVIAAVERVTGKVVPCKYESRRPGDPAILVGDSARARELLEWRPRYENLDDIVSSAVEWHRTQAL